MTHTDDALTEAVAEAIRDEHWGEMKPIMEAWSDMDAKSRRKYLDLARAALAAVRAHDEQAALNCGHCSEPDEIACACQIKERDDE